MKKIISIILTGIIISSATSSKVTAQIPGKDPALVSARNIAALASYVRENSGDENVDNTVTKESLREAKMNLKASKASFKATENFKKQFKDAPDATWNVGEEAILATFYRDGIRTNVVYNKRGALVHTLRYFPADKIPGNIRSIVESDYPNGDLTQAIQIQEDGIEGYVVQLEDKRTYKEVSVYDGQTNLIKEFNKILK